MDVIVENMPHVLPQGAEHYISLFTSKPKPANSLAAFHLVKAMADIEKSFVRSKSTGSRLAAWYDVRNAIPIETDAQSDQQLALFISELDNVDADLQELNQMHLCIRKHQPKPFPKHPSWETAMQNRANTNLQQMRPHHANLETTKIFLPQGAALILRAWQEDLNAFVAEVEQLSIDPERASLQKIPFSKLYNLPRRARPPYGEFDLVKYHKLPALQVVEDDSNDQYLTIPQLAAQFAIGAEEAVVGPSRWFQVYICFTEVITGADFSTKGRKVWCASRL